MRVGLVPTWKPLDEDGPSHGTPARKSTHHPTILGYIGEPVIEDDRWTNKIGGEPVYSSALHALLLPNRVFFTGGGSCLAVARASPTGILLPLRTVWQGNEPCGTALCSSAPSRWPRSSRAFS